MNRAVLARPGHLSRLRILLRRSPVVAILGARQIGKIHEMLHTLGLRENPPSSDAINVQVRKRCGS